MRILSFARGPRPSRHLERVGIEGEVVATVADRPAGPLSILQMALWFGIVGGLAEMLVVAGRYVLFGTAALGGLQMNRHSLGLIVVADALIVGLAGLPSVLVVAFRRHRHLERAIVLGLAFLGWFTALQPLKGISTTAHALLAAGLAAAVARQIWARPVGFRRLCRVTLPGLAVVAAVVAILPFVLEARDERQALNSLPAASPGSPNVLFVVLDTVRADALSSYGYHRATTPNLDRLASRGMRFANARAAGAWTLPSHATMFTGRWPHELSTRIDKPLDDTYPTIAEYLGRHGYTTAGFIANTWFCNPWYGLSRGFVRYEATPLNARTLLMASGLGRRLAKRLGTAANERPAAGLPRKDSQTINRELLGWLDARQEGDRPFFAFLNYYDAHDPYLLHDEPDPCFGLRPDSAADRDLLREWLTAKKPIRTPRELKMARDCYDDCLKYLDTQVGAMLDGLESRGLLESTWIIVTADHGEQFGEHGVFLHGNSLYLGNFHVPLLVIPPQGQGPEPKTISSAVSLRDLPATIVDLLGLEADAPFPGRSLARHWEEQTVPGPIEDEVYYEMIDVLATQPLKKEVPRVVELAGHSYLRQHDGTEELYDVVADPGQTRNLVTDPASAAILNRLREAMARYPGQPTR